jgi:hypothetical protein
MAQDLQVSSAEREVYAALLIGLDRRYREADEAAGSASAPEDRAAAERRRLACRRTFEALRADMAQRGLVLADQAATVRDSAA